MEKYIEEVTAEEAKENIINQTIADKTGSDKETIEKLPTEVKDALVTAVSSMEESLFDDLWDDEMSLLENVSSIVKEMSIREASETSVINAIVKFTGMKFEEATEVFENTRA